MSTAGRGRMKPEERRAHLLDCAGDVLLDRGADAVTLDAVASRAEVTRALLYHYFDSRDDLLVELFVTVSERFDHRFGEITDSVSSIDELVESVVGVYLDESERDGRILSALDHASTESGELEGRRATRIFHLFLGLAAVVQQVTGADLKEAGFGAAMAMGAAQTGSFYARTVLIDEAETRARLGEFISAALRTLGSADRP